MPGGINRRNDEMVNMQAVDFRRRYAPEHAFADAVAMFLTLPGLIGFWPGSAMGAAGLLNDLSGNGIQMTNNNNADFSAASSTLVPWLEFDGSNQYFSRADTALLDVAGNEAYVAAAVQGLTLGGWFWCDTSGAAQGFMNKYVVPNQKSYLLQRNSFNQAYFEVSADGANGTGITGGDSPTITAGAWFFVWGRYISDSPLIVAVNNAQTTAGGNAPAAPLFNSTSAFEIGRLSSGSYLNGRASMCFLCAAAVPDVHLTTAYEFTRAMYNR